MCGPCPKEKLKLAETTPTAHFECNAFCCDLQSLSSLGDGWLEDDDEFGDVFAAKTGTVRASDK